MEFEELTLRPVAGVVDEATVAAWLDARAHVFRDPVAGLAWHMSASARTASAAIAARQADPRRFPLGVLVSVYPDRIVLGGIADRPDLARALELVEWLVRGGAWTAAIDRGPAAPIDDPRRLFPAALPDGRALDNADATGSPVKEGRLLTWVDDRQPGVELLVHSSGACRYVDGGRTLIGDLVPSEAAAFDAAVAEAAAAIDPDASPAGEPPVRIEIEDAAGVEYQYLDPRTPPDGTRKVVALVAPWIEALRGWKTGSPPPGFDDVREIR